MNAQQPLTDERIRSALERRSDVNVPGDLRRLVISGIGAQPQRRTWQARAAEVLSGPDRRFALPALVALALLIAAMMAIALVGSPEPMPRGRGSDIAFVSSGDLWVADADGANPRRIWDLPGEFIGVRPTWVDRVTVLVQEIGGGVYAVDLRRSTQRLLAPGGALLALSPDHRQVAIGFGGPGGPHISITEIESGVQVANVQVHGAFTPLDDPQIGPQVGLTGGPHAWSRDGRWLLGQGFGRDLQQSNTVGWIYQLDVATGEIRDLARNLCCGLDKPNPVLAPDASSVVYVTFHQAATGEACEFRCGSLWSLDPVAGTGRQLTADAGSELGPVFSPDGSWIAFAEYVGPGHDLAIVRADGSGRQKVTGFGDVYASTSNLEPYGYIAWDTDGTGLTFMRWPPGARVPTGELELWHLELAGLVERRLGAFTLTEFAP